MVTIQLATRLLHRHTTLISGPVSNAYSLLPLSDIPLDSNTEAGAEKGKTWKDSSVEMDWPTWRTTMYVLDTVSLAGLKLISSPLLKVFHQPSCSPCLWCYPTGLVRMHSFDERIIAQR